MQEIFAHRGASGYAPENTLEAFALAAKQGAHGVELDVHLSKDGEIVVTHDETIKRVTGQDGNVRDMTVKELKSILFNKPFPEYKEATIPTLREVYALLGPTGLKVNVELKNSNIDYPDLEAKCLALAEEMGMSGRVLYSSFNHYSMVRMKKLCKEAYCGLLYSATMVRPWEYAKALGVDALHPHMSELLVDNECEEAHKLGLEINTWTVNTAEHVRLVLQAGADDVITNYPDIALAVLREM